MLKKLERIWSGRRSHFFIMGPPAQRPLPIYRQPTGLRPRAPNTHDERERCVSKQWLPCGVPVMPEDAGEG